MTHAPRRFLVAFAALVVGGMLALVVVNALVDPYDVIHIVSIPWLPHRPAQEGHDRLHKTALIRAEKPDGLILGTSRAQVMVDPESPAFAGHADHMVNAAVNGAQPYDYLRLFQHAHALRPQRLLVVSLDLLAFDAGGKVPPALEEARFAVDVERAPQPLSPLHDIPATLLSEDALRSSLSTLRRREDPSYLTRLGMRTSAYQERERARAGGVLAYFRASEKDYLGSYACAHPFEVKGVPVDGPTKPLVDLGRTLEAARAAHAAVRLYFSPVHARHMVVLEAAGLLDAQDRWKRAVAAVVERARADGLDVELFDFQGLPGVFDEPVDDRAPRWWWESSHATPALGAVLLPRLVGEHPPDIRAGVEEIRARAAAWEGDHIEEVQEIRSLAAEILPQERRARGCSTRSHL